jgi:hypothetical protein
LNRLLVEGRRVGIGLTDFVFICGQEASTYEGRKRDDEHDGAHFRFTS